MSNMIHPAGPEEDGAPGYGYDYDEEKPRGRLRRPAIAIVGLAVLAGGIWFAYGTGPKRAPGEVPLIHADETATKTRPNQPGGMAIPDQDKLVYNQGRGQPQVEKLLPGPETPLPRPVAPEDSATDLPTGSAGAPAIVASGATPQPAASVAAATPPSSPPPVVTPAAPAPVAPPVAAAPARPPASPPVATAAPPRIASTGGYRLQVGAMRSEDAAKKEWERIKAANKDLVGTLAAVWPRVDLGTKGIYYRIQTAPIADAATADRLCNALKQRNVGCLIVRP